MRIGHVELTLLVELAVVETLAKVGATRWVTARRSNDERVTTADSVVECPECSAVTEAGYRYCRTCVNGLPGGASFAWRQTTPLGGFAR